MLLSGGTGITSFAVVTNRYDNARSGANTAETQLTTSNVNSAHFGLLFSRSISGYVYGQPLYAGGISVGGVKHNVVYVATEHNMITRSTPTRLRRVGTALVALAGRAVDPRGGRATIPAAAICRIEVGITSTPVISLADNVIYLVAKTDSNQQLHALDLATGADVFRVAEHNRCRADVVRSAHSPQPHRGCCC